MTTFHYKTLGYKIYQTFVLIIWHLDELEVSWDNNTCELIHKKCHHYNTNHYMTLITS